MTSALPDASRVPLHRDLKATLTIQKGSIEQRSTGGHVRLLSFKASEGYNVLRAKHIRLFEEIAAEQQLVLNDDCVDETFESHLGQRWKRISAGDRSSWDGDVVGNFQFEFFLYCSSRAASSVPSFHRATAARIRAAAVALQRFQQESDMTPDPITMSHLVTTQAWQSNINNSSGGDDKQNARSKVGTIRLEVNGLWVEYRVDVLSLRRALGLPLRDIFTEGIYHGFQSVAAHEQDLQDVDHMELENSTLSDVV